MTGIWLDSANLTPLTSALTSMAGGPRIGRRAAQRLARRELAERGFWQEVQHRISQLLNSAGTAVPRGWFGPIVLVILAVLVFVVVVFWVRPARTRKAEAESVLTGAAKTAQDYRRSAQRLAAAGDYAAAIVDGVRAIAAELDERGILPPRPGRTADELALEAGRELPDLGADLRAATRLFDDVRYGDKDGTKAGYQLVSRVDREVRSARVRDADAAPAALAGLGVPQ